MTKESLIAAGFTEEQATNIMKMHQQAIDGHYVPKATFEAEREKSKSLTTQVADRDKQITELGAFKGTAEQLQTRVSELETQNKQAQEKFNADLLQAQKDAAIRFDISSLVIDPEDVLPKLDQTKIVFADGKITSGLKEQLDEMKKSKPHYFKQEGGNDEGGLPKGWFFGKTPPEGSEGGSETHSTKSEAEKFGEMIAASKVSGTNAASKAAETYFK